MDKLSIANQCLRTARDNHERAYQAQLEKLDRKENSLAERLRELDTKKIEIANANGKEDAAGDDLIEINAGGKIIAAKRSTLTQLKGGRFEALFSGRWDKKLQRDSHGRVFLDVNPLCFQAIVDYLNEMTISSEDSPPALPSVDDEHKQIIKHQLELFGILSKVPSAPLPEIESNIVRDESRVSQLNDWLKEDGKDVYLRLLYSSSRDGTSSSAFHSKCDNQGCTLTIIETIDATGVSVFGGYSNTPWTNGSSNGNWRTADRAFLFVLSGSGVSSPFKMRLKKSNTCKAVYHHSSYGPTFGRAHDLMVYGGSAQWKVGQTTYQPLSSFLPAAATQQKSSYHIKVIKEMEVFQVITDTSVAANQKPSPNSKLLELNQVDCFSKEVNAAINGKRASLREAEEEVLNLEERFNDETTFISSFASGRPQDVVLLNVCGTIMASRLQTLQLRKESALASEFSTDKSEERTPDPKGIKEWNYEDVVAWLNQLGVISESVVDEFAENQVTGRELLALGAEGLKDFGVARKGTVYLLLEEIKKLENAGSNQATLIEHSPYCFEKILDHLRLEASYMKGLVKSKHGLPVIRESEQGRYQKVLNHLFPGASSIVFHDGCKVDAVQDAMFEVLGDDAVKQDADY